jgi:hypothetical protein
MNKFTQHIPNFCDGFEPDVFEFTDLQDLCKKLNMKESSLVYSEKNILEVNENETYWWVLGKVENKVDGLRKWRGAPYRVVEIETIRGWGLESFDPVIIGSHFYIRSDEIESYSGFRDGIIGELKNGKCFMGSSVSRSS